MQAVPILNFFIEMLIAPKKTECLALSEVTHGLQSAFRCFNLSICISKLPTVDLVYR